MAGSVYPAASESVGGTGTRVRWTVVALLFGATTVNYIDRQVLAILAPTLTRELGWRETDYAGIVSWFSVAYGDRKSTRLNSSHSQISYAVFCLKKKKPTKLEQ